MLDTALGEGQLYGRAPAAGQRAATSAGTLGELDPSTDPLTQGALDLSVYVSSDYGSGYIEMAGDGTVKQINYPS